MILDIESPERLRPTSVAQLQKHLGTELGVSRWRQVTQDDVDAFAAVTGDRQWIHTDPTRAASGPFGGTIAHGYYTLSLAPALIDEVVSFDGFAMAVNDGLEKLTFESSRGGGPVCVAHAMYRVFEDER